MSRRFVAVAILLAIFVWSGTASARRLTVTTSKTETLNAISTETDCSALSKTPDAQLPLHIVRIAVTPPAGVNGLVRYEWLLPKPNVGTLVADQDIPQGEQAAVIQALCAEVGNECALTEEQLKIYDKTTILWVAPVCADTLPQDATKPYRGGQVKIGVKAFAGKRKAGKGTVSVGYGRTAGVTMGINGKTGNGKAVDCGLEAQFGATVDSAGVTLPAIDGFEFDNGDGDGGVVPAAGLQASTVLDYGTAGKHTGTVTVQLHDGSALCDSIVGNVLTSDNRISLSVTTTPQGTFHPGDPSTGTVNVRVRVKNTSDPSVARGVVLLKGANVLSCDTEIKVGSSTLTKSTSIDFQHCSSTIDEGCQSDADCGQAACPDCQVGEVCLASSHCAFQGTSGFDVRGCVRDADCGPGGSCVKVLPVTSLVLPIGDSSELLNVSIPVANTLSSTAKVKETWTVHARNAGDASDSVSYSITSNPGLRP
jgi:hypothetical protein